MISQADIDAGTFTNSASATTVGGASDSDSELATGPTRTQSFTLAKTSADSFGAVGDVVTFEFAVMNTGNTTLTAVTVSDTFFDPDLVCVIGTLTPQATDNTTCSASYAVTQDDLNAGSITNTASLSGTGPLGPLTPVPSTAVVTADPEMAALTIDKVETDGDGIFGAAGTLEGYGFTITNTGLVTLINITIVDPLTGLNCAIDDLLPGASAVACSDTTAFAGDYEITQADINAGSLTNVVTVNAQTLQGTLLEETDTVILAGPVQDPKLSMVKSTTPAAGFAAIGDTIDYTYVVTNDGNITLTAPISVADDRVSVSCPALPAGGLAPLASITCTATETVDQADLDAGDVINKATANISQPVLPSALHPTGTAAVASDEETVTVTGTQSPSLVLLKDLSSLSAVSYGGLSDVLTFEFVVTNTGNVTTTGPVSVYDSVLDATIACGPVAGGIAPGGQVTCTLDWTPLQGDIDAGEFTNSAVASMDYAGVAVPSGSASKTVYAVQRPEMTVAKTYRAGSLGTFTVGEVATYDYVITNTGNQTLVLPITIEDNLIAPADLDCSAITAPLAPGETGACVGTYTLGLTDVQLGSAVNVAKGVSPTVESQTVSDYSARWCACACDHEGCGCVDVCGGWGQDCLYV